MAYLSPLQWAVNEFGIFCIHNSIYKRVVNLLFLVFQQKFTH